MEFMDEVLMTAALITTDDIRAVPGLGNLTADTVDCFEYICGDASTAGYLTLILGEPELVVRFLAVTVASIGSPRKAAIYVFSYLMRKGAALREQEAARIEQATAGLEKQ